jgi:hypothetical protein
MPPHAILVGLCLRPELDLRNRIAMGRYGIRWLLPDPGCPIIAAIAEGKHLDSFRTQKLSPLTRCVVLRCESPWEAWFVAVNFPSLKDSSSDILLCELQSFDCQFSVTHGFVTFFTWRPASVVIPSPELWERSRGAPPPGTASTGVDRRTFDEVDVTVTPCSTCSCITCREEDGSPGDPLQ